MCSRWEFYIKEAKVRHKEANGRKGKFLQQTGEGREWNRNTKRKNQKEKDTGREKVRRSDGKCSGEKGYLCVSVVSTAGCHLKGSQASYGGREKRTAVRKMAD